MARKSLRHAANRLRTSSSARPVMPYGRSPPEPSPAPLAQRRARDHQSSSSMAEPPRGRRHHERPLRTPATTFGRHDVATRDRTLAPQLLQPIQFCHRSLSCGNVYIQPAGRTATPREQRPAGRLQRERDLPRHTVEVLHRRRAGCPLAGSSAGAVAVAQVEPARARGDEDPSGLVEHGHQAGDVVVEVFLEPVLRVRPSCPAPRALRPVDSVCPPGRRVRTGRVPALPAAGAVVAKSSLNHDKLRSVPLSPAAEDTLGGRGLLGALGAACQL